MHPPHESNSPDAAAQTGVQVSSMNAKTLLDRGTPILESARIPKPIRLRKATLAEAKEMDRKAVRIIAETKAGWLRLGMLIHKMAETLAFETLGFASMHSWMTKRFGESLSSAYSALRSVRALQGVSEDKLEKIGERNAHVLTRLPVPERTRDEWMEKAANLPTKVLVAQVDAAIEKKTGLPKERFRFWGEAVPESVAQKLDEMLEKIGRVLELDMTQRYGRITALEALAATILNTPDEQLKAETEGDEEAGCSFGRSQTQRR
jgi:hypothetical protein